MLLRSGVRSAGADVGVVVGENPVRIVESDPRVQHPHVEVVVEVQREAVDLHERAVAIAGGACVVASVAGSFPALVCNAISERACQFVRTVAKP